MFWCKEFAPYMIQKIYEDGSVVVNDAGDSKVFNAKSKEIRVLPTIDKASEMVSPVIGEPLALESS